MFLFIHTQPFSYALYLYPNKTYHAISNLLLTIQKLHKNKQSILSLFHPAAAPAIWLRSADQLRARPFDPAARGAARSSSDDRGAGANPTRIYRRHRSPVRSPISSTDWRQGSTQNCGKLRRIAKKSINPCCCWLLRPQRRGERWLYLCNRWVWRMGWFEGFCGGFRWFVEGGKLNIWELGKLKRES